MSILGIAFDPTLTVALLADGYYVDGAKQKSWSSKGNNVVSSYGIYVPSESGAETANVVALSSATDTVSGTSSSVRTNLDSGCGFVVAFASGVVIDFGATLDFKGGNDYLYGTGNALGSFIDGSGLLITGAAGLINAGTTLMGSGQDQVSGYGNATAIALGYENLANAAVGVGVLNIGTLSTGSDADTITGTGIATLAVADGCSLANASVASGVFNVGLIDMGSGNNRLVASATATATQAETFSFLNGAVAAGVFNGLGVLQNAETFPFSTITSSGSGDKSQEINGTANAVLTSVLFDGDVPNAFINGAIAAGIWNGVNNVITLSNGSAKITGTATAQATAVNTGGEYFDATLAAGIFNAGSLSTGSSNDVITGQATIAVQTLGYPLDLAAGILNVGTISTGSGNDILDALTGGFKGNGVANLGSGNDTVRGFGGGYFDGGSNIDLLTLNKGTYQISATADASRDGVSYFTITSSNDEEMYVTSFERLTTSSGIVGFAADTSFTV